MADTDHEVRRSISTAPASRLSQVVMPTESPARGGTLCVLAHQDDEIAMAARIGYEVLAGAAVYCAVLTNGMGGLAESSVRDTETLRVLTALGVHPENVFFIGSRHDIPDLHLVEHLERCLELVCRYTDSLKLERAFCLAFEGGHMDHDAANLVALAVAKRRAIELWQFPYYQGQGTPGPFFRVMSPIRNGSEVRRRRLAIAEGIHVVRQCFHYKSQRRSWMGLLPGVFLRLVVLRQEVMQRASAEAILRRPHKGVLFYERRFGVRHEAWRECADPFVKAHLSAEDPTP